MKLSQKGLFSPKFQIQTAEILFLEALLVFLLISEGKEPVGLKVRGKAAQKTTGERSLIHPGGICLCRKTGAAQQLRYFKNKSEIPGLAA